MNIPRGRVLRFPETESLTGYKRPSLYRLEKEGRFPTRIKLGEGQGGAVGYLEADVLDWLDAKAAGRKWTPSTKGGRNE
jgi:prophage regulatory protein